jgi:predicted nucleotidyltransferase
MNDLTIQIKSMILVSDGLDVNFSEVNRQLNRIPMSAIKYKISIDELKRRLADTHE